MTFNGMSHGGLLIAILGSISITLGIGIQLLLSYRDKNGSRVTDVFVFVGFGVMLVGCAAALLGGGLR